MSPLAPAILGGLWGGSELWLALGKRSRSNSVSKDRHSLRLIWLVISLAIGLGVAASRHLPGWGLQPLGLIRALAWGAFGAGTVLRWHSIRLLGRFFTVDVAISQDHHLVETGPYRFLRHPSYTGLLAAAFGFALSLGNLAAILIIVPSCAAALLWRIRIEEAALVEGLGESYAAYQRRTWRLVPGLF